MKSWSEFTEWADGLHYEEIEKAVSYLNERNTIVAKAAEPDEYWEEARPGFFRVGDIIRVKADAFPGKTGEVHNGRVGRIVAVRRGDIIMRSTDGIEPLIDGAHYSAHSMEKRWS